VAPEELIRELAHYRVSESEFYRVRALRPEELSPVQSAARFIYLNKTCYNGVYRVNKSGQFNTPFGHYKRLALVDEENLRRASELLKNAILVCQDYQAVLASAKEGDFVYFDPPYLPVSKFSDFKRYTREFFYEADQEQLAHVYSSPTRTGCLVLLSNSYHDKIARWYSGYSQTKVQVPGSQRRRRGNDKSKGKGIGINSFWKTSPMAAILYMHSRHQRLSLISVAVAPTLLP